MTDVVEPDYVEDLPLSECCVEGMAKKNANNPSIWTAKFAQVKGETAPMGQMSFEAPIMFPILKPKQDGTMPGPTENRSCVIEIMPKHVKFIDQCRVMDEAALAHFITHRAHYWSKTTSEDSVREKFVPLVKPFIDKEKNDTGKKMFTMKIRPDKRMRKGQVVPRKNPSRLTEILPGGEDAEEYTPIDKVHPHPDENNTSTATMIQAVIRFACVYRIDGKCGLSAHLEQGWFRYIVPKVFKRRGKRSKPEPALADVRQAAMADAPPAKVVTLDTTEDAPVPAADTGGGTKGDDDVVDDYEDDAADYV